MRLILASASPARLSTLRRAGLDPEVVVSGIDESALRRSEAAEMAYQLARLKCQTVHARADDALVIGCDSVLEFGGQTFGKPADAPDAARRWRQMRGRRGTLHTGHTVRLDSRELSRTASTIVHFAEISDAEIDAYVATGEPLHVAGAFTIDGLGGAFIERIEGDPHNVVGISLPLLRTMLADLGVSWPSLWTSLRYP